MYGRLKIIGALYEFINFGLYPSQLWCKDTENTAVTFFLLLKLFLLMRLYGKATLLLIPAKNTMTSIVDMSTDYGNLVVFPVWLWTILLCISLYSIGIFSIANSSIISLSWILVFFLIAVEWFIFFLFLFTRISDYKWPRAKLLVKDQICG